MIEPGNRGYLFLTVKEKLGVNDIQDHEISTEEFLALLKQEDYDLTLGGTDLKGNLTLEGIDSSTCDLDFCTSNINGNVVIRDCRIDSLSFENTYIRGKLTMENVVITGNLLMPENMQELISGRALSIKNLQVKGEVSFQQM